MIYKMILGKLITYNKQCYSINHAFEHTYNNLSIALLDCVFVYWLHGRGSKIFHCLE